MNEFLRMATALDLSCIQYFLVLVLLATQETYGKPIGLSGTNASYFPTKAAGASSASGE